jgi:hypothetical protein
MYHAYTLVDAQINDYCPKLQKDPPVPLTVPPLFQETADPEARREIIRKDLKAGAQNVYLLRCAEKYHRMWWVLGLGGAVGLALVYLAVSVSLTPLHALQDMIGRMIYGLIPSVVQDPLGSTALAPRVAYASGHSERHRWNLGAGWIPSGCFIFGQS